MTFSLKRETNFKIHVSQTVPFCRKKDAKVAFSIFPGFFKVNWNEISSTSTSQQVPILRERGQTNVKIAFPEKMEE
jgi:hypothetical protein